MWHSHNTAVTGVFALVIVRARTPLPRQTRQSPRRLTIASLDVKSVTFFAKQKNVTLFTSSDAGVIEELELRSSSSITPR
jgi:hypothetical protein